MIDIHSHILYGIDDGSKNIEESIQMIKEAQKAGFTAIVSTSHYIEGSYETSAKERKKIIDELTSKITNIEIYNGAEAYVSGNMIKLINEGNLPTINESKYLLFELPMNNKLLNLEEIIYDLISNNITPIIAHPERYSYIQENPEILLDYIEKGVLFQCNYGSVIGKYGKQAMKTIKKLLKHNMVHFLGTDTHRKNSVYTEMDKILKKLRKIINEEKLLELSTLNPEKVIHNKSINIEEPIKIKRK